MHLRNVIDSDLDTINELNEQQHFRLSSLNNKLVDKIAIDDNNPVAYGIVKVLAEAVILVNKNVSLFKRAKALQKLLRVAFRACNEENIEQLHVFVRDEHVAQLLEKHYGFVRSSDIVLVKNMRD